MPQPLANASIAHRILRQYEWANDQLAARLDQLLRDPRQARAARRVRELIAAHDAIMEGLRTATRTWIGTQVPVLHAAGATWAAQAVGSSFAWTQPHLAAVEALAQRSWSDIAPRLRDITTETRRILRSLTSEATRAGLLESMTATDAGRMMAREAARHGLWSVEYRGGARHSMRDYADTVIRTTTAEAYNGGSLTQATTDGIGWIEYLDGAGCGVTSHDDPIEANGLIVPVGDVVLLSHPRCRRALAPAPFGAALADLDRDLGAELPAAAPVIAPTGRVDRQPRTPRRIAASA